MAAVTFEIGGLVEPPQTGLKKQFEGPWKRDENNNVLKAIT